MNRPESFYAELHCHSNFSFLDGASHPEELAAQAARLGLAALALTDHDGFYGVVRFSEAARAAGLATVFGAELTLAAAGPRTGVPDPDGHHLVVLARDPAGYARLSRVIAEAHLAGGEKGRPVVALGDLAAAHGDHWQILTGCRKGAVPAALVSEGPGAARRQLDRLVAAFGKAHVAVELWDHGGPLDSARNDGLARLAVESGLDVVATNNVHYVAPSCFPRATTLAAVRAGRPLDELAGWLPASSAACLRSGAEQARRFARWPGAVARAGRDRHGLRLRPAPGGPPPARLPGARPATASRAGWPSWSSGGAPSATAPAGPSGCRGPGPGSTTSWRSSGAWGSPATS